MQRGPAFSELLRSYRRRALLTQEALASKSGLSVRTVSDLERGIQQSPRPDTVRRLADALGLATIEAERLLATTTSPSPAEQSESPPHAEDPNVVRARAAVNANAWPEAMQLYSERLEALEARPDPIDELLCDSLLGFGDAATMGLQRHVARPAYVRAAGIALRLSSRDRLLHAAVGFGFMTKAGESGGGAEDLWHRALFVATDEDLVARAVLGSARAVAFMLDGFVDRAHALASHSLVLARRSEDPTAMATALAATCISGWGRPNSVERLALAQELAQLTPSFVPTTGLEGVELQAVPLLEQGRFDEFYAIVEQFERAAAEDHQPSVIAQCAQWGATRALLRGDLAEAEALAGRAAELAGHPPNFTMGHAAQLYSSRKLEGRDGELAEALRAMVQQHPGEPAWRVCLALTLARAGEVDEAQAMLNRARFEMWPLPSGWTRPVCLAFLIETSAIVRDAELASMCERELEPYAGLFLVPSTATSCEGSVERFLGLAALARGESHIARARLEDAVARERATGSPVLPSATERLLESV
jgi:transcriptional regulator with XRE-family HTH domain